MLGALACAEFHLACAAFCSRNMARLFAADWAQNLEILYLLCSPRERNGNDCSRHLELVVTCSIQSFRSDILQWRMNKSSLESRGFRIVLPTAIFKVQEKKGCWISGESLLFLVHVVYSECYVWSVTLHLMASEMRSSNNQTINISFLQNTIYQTDNLNFLEGQEISEDERIIWQESIQQKNKKKTKGKYCDLLVYK